MARTYWLVTLTVIVATAISHTLGFPYCVMGAGIEGLVYEGGRELEVVVYNFT